jgi:type IV secretory pathway VirB6-like protein
MNLAKKLTKIFSLIFLAIFLFSCEPGCIQSDEFDNEIVTVDSYPDRDGIEGNYPNQVASWHDTGLKLNGEKVVLQVSGAWTPWYGDDDSGSQSALNSLPACNFCAKNETSPNCICYSGQNPAVETTYSDQSISCADASNQNDPAKCTCTKNYGSATDYGVYHFPLDQLDKNQVPRIADEQSPCKYSRGIGLYLGMFGTSGNTSPLRAYHLFSQTEVCNVTRTNGECLDDSGKDVTQYIFSSADDRTFVKDDNQGNTGGPNANPGDDTLHARNETAKLIILDNYYNDNYGSYQVQFMSGVGKSEDPGLIEFFVRLIEDSVMGVADDDGNRQGGVIETLFNGIVLDSGFTSVLQISLSIYIMFYGVAVLMGIANISKKELMNRALKIGLVLFFTSESSWYFYNKLVVGFFKDSMDYVVAVIMDLSDRSIDPTSAIVSAQMDRITSISNATRFSYVDLIIKKLLSVAATKKIFGLFFGVPLFGIVYIFVIYALIAFFIYVMLFVGMMYVVAITKLAFVLALGPIFISFTLSSHTNDMFKKWLAFLGARSLEIIFLFLVLYNFLILIDTNFTSLLSYKTCVKNWNLGFFVIPILSAETSRNLPAWFSAFIILGGLIFITKLIIDKVPDLAGALISIGGTGNKSGSGVAKMAGNLMSGIAGAMTTVTGSDGLNLVGNAVTFGAKTIQGGTEVMRRAKSSVGGALSGAISSVPGGSAAINAAGKTWSMLPSSPRAMYRNSIIDSAISKAKAEVKATGKTGKDADLAIRAEVMKTLQSPGANKTASLNSNPGKMALAGVDLKTIGDRLDQKLIHEPLRDFIKTEAQKMRNGPDPLIGKDARKALKTKIDEWAEKNLVGGKDSITEIMKDRGRVVDGVSWGGVGLRNMKEFIRNQTELSSAEAAKSFANNPEKQKQYLQYLEEAKFDKNKPRADMTQRAWSKTFNTVSNAAYDKVSGVISAVKPLDSMFSKDTIHDPKRAQESFLRKVSNEETKKGTVADYMRRKTGSWLKYDQGSALNPLNLSKSKRAIEQNVKEGERAGLVNYLSKGLADREKKRVDEKYDEKRAQAPNHAAKQKIESKREQKLSVTKEKREFFKKRLTDVAIKTAGKNSDKIARDLEKIRKLEADNRAKSRQQVLNMASSAFKENFSDPLTLAIQRSKDNSSAIARNQDRIAKLEEENRKKSTPEILEKIAKEQESLLKGQRDQVKYDKDLGALQEKAETEKTRLKTENEKLKKEKENNVTEIVKLKTDVKSLEDVIKEIEDLKKADGIRENIINALVSAEERKAQKEADEKRSEEIKVALGIQLRKEYEEALTKQINRVESLLEKDEKDALNRYKEVEGKKIKEELKELEKRLLQKLEEEVEKIKADSPQELLDKSKERQDDLKMEYATERDQMIRKYHEEVRKKAENSLEDLSKISEEQMEKVRDNGGIEAIKDGLIDIDESTLYEKLARLKYYEDKFGGVIEGASGQNTGGFSADLAVEEGKSDAAGVLTSGDAPEVVIGTESLRASIEAAKEKSEENFQEKLEVIKEKIADLTDKNESPSEELIKELESLKEHGFLGKDKADDEKDSDAKKAKSEKDKSEKAKSEKAKSEKDRAKENLTLKMNQAKGQHAIASAEAKIIEAKITNLMDRKNKEGDPDGSLQKEIDNQKDSLSTAKSNVEAIAGEMTTIQSEMSGL